MLGTPDESGSIKGAGVWPRLLFPVDPLPAPVTLSMTSISTLHFTHQAACARIGIDNYRTLYPILGPGVKIPSFLKDVVNFC